METLKPNEQRAKLVLAFLWISLALEVLSFFSGYLQYGLLQLAANGTEITINEANANDMRESIIGICSMVVYIITAVMFIMWFRRAYFNLHIKVKNLIYTEGWAAGCWFVPFINLYRPQQIMRELYEETRALLSKKGLLSIDSISTSAIGWWWALWIISNILGQLVFRISMKAESVDELITTTVMSMISNIVGIPLAIVAIKVVKDYAKIEPLLFEVKEEENAVELNSKLV